MRRLWWLLALALALPAQAQVWPYPYTMKDLPNGMRVVLVPTDEPELVALQVVMQVGSRNEVEAGKTGFAHFFEHMMFRGTRRYPPEKARQMLQKLGVDANAWTSMDQTVYHDTFSKDSLATILDYEADRFQHLEYTPDDVRTESQAVLGEYNKNSANPEEKLDEVMQETAFHVHTYRHTTMGFLKDIQAMPEEFDYSRTFFQRFYRPENALLILAGAVRPDEVMPLVEKTFGAWKGASEKAPSIPPEPPQQEPHQAHVDWPTHTLPWVVVAYKVPAFSDTSLEWAALRVIPELAFSETSSFYRQWVLKEQRIDSLEPDFRGHRDPSLVEVGARVRSSEDLEPVKAALLQECEGLARQPIDPQRLEAVKSRLRYAFLGRLDDPEKVAGALVPLVSLTRTPESVDRVFQALARLTPQDIQGVAQRIFVPAGRTVVTLSSAGQP